MDLIYEWEDILSKELQLPFRYSLFGIKHLIGGVNKFAPWFWKLPGPRDYCLEFVVRFCFDDWFCAGKRKVIPVIVDFWESSTAGVKAFCKRYGNNKLILITSRQAFIFLRQHAPQLPVVHWALSLPDYYAITPETKFEKKFDCVLVGRTNKVLVGWMKRYAAEHEDFVYVYNTRVPGSKNDVNCFCSSSGEVLGDICKSRGDYFNLMRQSRAGLYSTPCIDDGSSLYVHTGDLMPHGFDQVTPRFLEYIACGCHVLARYPENEDTDWYDLPKMAPHIETYERFVIEMDRARTTPVDMKKYSDYLAQHYTSVRARQLKEIVKALT